MAHSGVRITTFDHFRAIPTPEVCPNAESPADWAARALHFQPSKLQTEILNYTGDRLILCCARQWGKSTIVAIKALYEAVHNPGTVTIILSRTKPQASIILQRIRANMAALGFPIKRHQGRDHSIALPNGAAIFADRKSTRLNSSHVSESRMPSSA